MLRTLTGAVGVFLHNVMAVHRSDVQLITWLTLHPCRWFICLLRRLQLQIIVLPAAAWEF
jgi:hypothetical protein